MKNNKNSLVRQIVLSTTRISLILGIALSVILFSGTALNAQSPSSYGKPLVVNGKLQYIPSATHTITSMASGNARYFHYEPIGNKFAKVDDIIKAPDRRLSLRINGTEFAICLIRKNPSNASPNNNSPNRFSGTIKLSSTGPVPVKVVAEEEKKGDEKKNDEKKTEEESKKPEQIYPIIVLLQDRNGLIRLLIQTDKQTIEEYQVKNFWELYILVPEKYQKDFLELMRAYSSSIFTNEQNMRNRVYNAIAKSVQFNEDNHQDYQRMIDDLSSDVYMKRVAAMNRIQEAGNDFLSYVQKIDMNQFEPEARVRLGDILSANSYVCDTDDVDDISVLFGHFLYANIPLLESDVPSFNSVARERLEAKLGGSFKYDKSAPDDVRAVQIQELKNALGFPKPRTIQIDEHTQQRFNDLIEALFDQNLSTFKF